MSELSKTGGNSTHEEVCESSFTDGLLYIYMALALLVCFPVAGHIFDHMQTMRQRLIILIGLYCACVCLVAVIPFANTSWQFALVAVGIGVSRTPDVLHPAFLLTICSSEMYPYAYALLLMISAVVDAATPPIVGKCLSQWNFVLSIPPFICSLCNNYYWFLAVGGLC